MGTSYSIRYVAGDDTPSAREMQAEIDKRLEQVNDQMSTYRPDSELSRFNASRDIDRPFPVSPATAKVVREALRINRVTDGALDVTVGPLVNLWGFGPEGRPDKVPSEAELAHRRAWTGAEKLSVQGSALVKSIPELYVDLSSIAKGYGVDVVAEYLQSQTRERLHGGYRRRSPHPRAQWRAKAVAHRHRAPDRRYAAAGAAGDPAGGDVDRHLG